MRVGSTVVYSYLLAVHEQLVMQSPLHEVLFVLVQVSWCACTRASVGSNRYMHTIA